jgi:hypothetical protein
VWAKNYYTHNVELLVDDRRVDSVELSWTNMRDWAQRALDGRMEAVIVLSEERKSARISTDRRER